MTDNTATRNGEFPQDVPEAAMQYAARSWATIPVPYRAKRPAFDGWQNFRWSPESIEEHFPAGRESNIGLLTGSPSQNLVDVDLDCSEAIAAARHILPPTDLIFGRASAPSSHYLYRIDRPVEKAKFKYRDLDGSMLIELRGDGCMTVVPPSAHEEAGEVIRWDRFGEPGVYPVERLRRTVGVVASITILSRHWVAEGSRQDAHLALVGGLLRGGLNARQVCAIVEALAGITRDEELPKRVECIEATAKKLQRGDNATGFPTLERLLGRDGEAVVAKVREWLGLTCPGSAPGGGSSKAVPVAIEPYEPFPVEALPSPLAEFVREGAAALGCDPAYLGVPALTVAGGATGNSRVIRLKPGWEEPPIIWSSLIGDSGTLKSPAMHLATEHLHRRQYELNDAYRRRYAAYQDELDAHKAAAKAPRNKGEVADPKPSPPPPAERIVTNDVTIESLAEILSRNPRGVTVVRDEQAGWIGSFNRYKTTQGGGDLAQWLETHRAGPILVDRKTGQPPLLSIGRASVCVTGTVQPGTFSRIITEEFMECGLTARLLLAMPPRSKKVWSEQVVSPEAREAYERLIDDLLGLEPCSLSAGGWSPVPLELSPEAKARWVTFYGEWAAEQHAAEGELAAALAKLEAYAARLALVHHVVTHVGRGEDDRVPVGVESVEAGITLTRWFAAECRRVYQTLAESREEREARTLFEFIRRKGGRISVRELQRSNSRKYRTAEAAEESLNGLVTAGWATWVEGDLPEGGGHRERFAQLNPSPGGGDAGAPPGDGPDTPDGDGDDDCDDDDPAGPPGSVRAGPAMIPFSVVRDPAGLTALTDAIGGAERVAVEITTDGTLGFATPGPDGGPDSFVLDLQQVDPTPVLHALAGKRLAVHDAAAKLDSLTDLGFVPGVIDDALLMVQVLAAGTRYPCDLVGAARARLPVVTHAPAALSSGQPPASSAARAAWGAAAVLYLQEAFLQDIEQEGLEAVVDLERRCQPAVRWMARSGVPFDGELWRHLSADADAEVARLERELNDLAGSPGPDARNRPWNWGNSAHVREALRAAGHDRNDASDDTLAAVDHPLAGLVRRYRAARNRASNYGRHWCDHLDGGRVYPSWHQIGTATGRMACSGPNVQSMPRGEYRRCVAAPPGRVLVRADYSQIELRILAQVSGDERLLEAFRRGDDVHELTARSVLRKSEVTRADRRLAKSINFGLSYGMGATCLRRYIHSGYGIALTEEQARACHAGFFRAYPGVAAWQRETLSRRETWVRTPLGRRRFIPQGATDAVRLNSPIQGSGADGLKLALALLWERRGEVPGAFPILAVHDELVAECDEAQAEAVSGWLRRVMIDGMAPLIDPVPVEIEVSAGRTWGGDRGGDQ